MGNRPKRILFVSHSAAISGPTQSLAALLPFLTPKYEPLVLIPEAGPLWSWLIREGIPAHMMSDAHTRGVSKMAQLVSREKVDLVYGNNPSTFARNALVASRLMHRPYVWHIRSVKWHWTWADGFFLQLANQVIAVSQACARPLLRFVHAKKVHVIYNGVELSAFQGNRQEARQYLLEQFKLPEDAITLVSVGHLRPGKGQAEQVEVMRKLALSHPNLHLVLIGSLIRDPEYVAEVRRQISVNGLEQRIHLVGVREDVPRLLSGADMYIHTSKQEAHPRAVIEAMAAGLPVVAFSVGGVSETVVDGQTGCLIEPGDLDGMSQGIKDLLDSPQLLAAFGEAGRKRVEQHFTAAGTATQIDQVLQKVLEKGWQ